MIDDPSWPCAGPDCTCDRRDELWDLTEDAERHLLLANLDMVLAEWLSSDEWASAATRRALDFLIDPWRPLTTLTPSEVYL